MWENLFIVHKTYYMLIFFQIFCICACPCVPIANERMNIMRTNFLMQVLFFLYKISKFLATLFWIYICSFKGECFSDKIPRSLIETVVARTFPLFFNFGRRINGISSYFIIFMAMNHSFVLFSSLQTEVNSYFVSMSCKISLCHL